MEAMVTENNVYTRNLHDLIWKTPKTFKKEKESEKRFMFSCNFCVITICGLRRKGRTGVCSEL